MSAAASPFAGATAALFDLDGTLVRSSIDFSAMRSGLSALARGRGLAPPAGSFDLLGFVRSGEEALAHSAGFHAASAWRRSALALLRSMEEAYCACAEALPGAVDLLDALARAGVPCAIVTRNCRAVASRLTHEVGLGGLPLITRDDTAYWKPDPRHLWRGLDALGRSDGAFVSVGDHWMDARAGRAAGATTVGLLFGRDRSRYAASVPDWYADDLAVVRGWVG